MTVASEAESATFAWTGVETSFAPGFRAQDPAHVRMTFTEAGGVQHELINGVHFAATLDGGGLATVVPLALPPAPASVLIYRRTPALQEVDFQNLGSFSPAIHTMLHDRAAMRAAEIRGALARALRPVSGWSAIPALVVDGSRVVFQIVAWAGGEGTPPASGQYIGAAGLVDAIGDAINVRGAAGAGTGDVIGPAGGTAAMQFAFYADPTGKEIRGGGTIAPDPLTASVSNYNPAGLSTAFLVRLSADAPWSITGLVGGVAMRPLILLNTGAPAITLATENGGSTAANRFAFAGDVVLEQHQAAFLVYDGTASRWRSAGGAAANGSIRQRHLAAGAVGSDQIQTGAVTADKLGAGLAPAVNAFNGISYR